MGDVVKLLLMKLIRLLIADAGVAALVIVIVKIVGDAGLGIGQVGKNGPVAGMGTAKVGIGQASAGAA